MPWRKEAGIWLSGMVWGSLSGPALAAESLECLIEPGVVVEVSSAETGVFEQVEVDASDVVREGDVIAQLDTDVEEAALELTRARAMAMTEQLSLLRKDYDFSTRKRERFEERLEQKAVSSQDIEDVRTEEELARLRLRAAIETRRATEFEARRDALALQRRIVRSPIDGVVSRRYKTAGEYVDGDPIVQLVQLDPLRIDLAAPASMFGQIKIGEQARVVPELEMEGEFVATVEAVDPMIDAATATFGVRLTLPNRDHRLPPGLKCSLVLDAHTRQSAGVPGTGMAGGSTVAATSTYSAATSPGFCVTLGPLDTAEQLSGLAAWLDAREFEFEQRTVEVLDAGMWVILSSERYDEPRSMVERLEAAGVGDFYLATTGHREGKFSYGVFRDKTLAEERVADMESLGFPAQLLPYSKRLNHTWLDLAEPPHSPERQSVLAEVLDDFPALSLESVECARLAKR